MADTYNFSDVFISYSRRDTEFAKRADHALKAHGYEVWIDWEDIPQSSDWWQEIEAGIEAADTFVFIISPASASSDICRREVEHAYKSKKRIVPVLYQPLVAEQSNDLHPALRLHNWLIVDTEHPNEIDEMMNDLVAVVSADLDHVRSHTRYLVRANEWRDREQDPSFLLHGVDASEAQQWLEQSISKAPEPSLLHAQYITRSVESENEKSNAIVRERRQAVYNSLSYLVLAFLGGFIGTGIFIWNQFIVTVGSLAVQRLVNVFGIGTPIGLILAIGTALGVWLPSRIETGGWWQRLVISSGVSMFTGLIIFIVYRFMFVQEAWSDLFWVGITPLAIGYSLGVILYVTFRVPAWIAFLVSTIGMLIPITILHFGYYEVTYTGVLLDYFSRDPLPVLALPSPSSLTLQHWYVSIFGDWKPIAPAFWMPLGHVNRVFITVPYLVLGIALGTFARPIWDAVWAFYLRQTRTD